MPAKLPEPQDKVTWRVETEDLALLNLLYPGKVNEVVRSLIHRACEKLREQGFGGVTQAGQEP